MNTIDTSTLLNLIADAVSTRGKEKTLLQVVCSSEAPLSDAAHLKLSERDASYMTMFLERVKDAVASNSISGRKLSCFFPLCVECDTLEDFLLPDSATPAAQHRGIADAAQSITSPRTLQVKEQSNFLASLLFKLLHVVHHQTSLHPVFSLKWKASLEMALEDLHSFVSNCIKVLLGAFEKMNFQVSASYRVISWEDCRDDFCGAICKVCTYFEETVWRLIIWTLQRCWDTPRAMAVSVNLMALTPTEAAKSVIVLINKYLFSAAAQTGANIEYISKSEKLLSILNTQSTGLLKELETLQSTIEFWVTNQFAVSQSSRLNVSSKGASASILTKSEQMDKSHLVNTPIPHSNTAPICSSSAHKTLEEFSAGVSMERALTLCELQSEEQNTFIPVVSSTSLPANSKTLTEVESVLNNKVQTYGISFKAPIPKSASSPIEKTSTISAECERKINVTPKPTEPASKPPITPAESAVNLPSKDTPGYQDPSAFWQRLKEKLSLNGQQITAIRSRCAFKNNSPYPGVYLSDIDVRNSDRLTRSFVEELEKSFSTQTSTITVRQVSLFCQAIAHFAEKLYERSVEVQSTLPFLSVRVEGELLGTLYAVMRADRQFQSLKDVREQILRGSSQIGGVKSYALSNVNKLLTERVCTLAKSLSSDESAQYTSNFSLRSSPQKQDSSTVSQSISPYAHLSSQVGGVKALTMSSLVTDRSDSHHPFQHPYSSALPPKVSSLTQALHQARNSQSSEKGPKFFPFDTVSEVYSRSCKHWNVAPNSQLLRQLSSTSLNSISKLDLSTNYIGVRGFRPLLSLLEFNGSKLISLSLCNNNLENEEVEELCDVLSGPPGKSLILLDLSYNPISQSGAMAIEKLMPNLPSLESLVLKGTLIGPRLIASLESMAAQQMRQRYASV